jgi:hypothetical protein
MNVPRGTYSSPGVVPIQVPERPIQFPGVPDQVPGVPYQVPGVSNQVPGVSNQVPGRSHTPVSATLAGDETIRQCST